MTDTNTILVLHDGREIPVIYPARIGREYETPWLGGGKPGSPGSREWNIDVQESLTEYRAGRMRHDPRFIIGKWGTPYMTGEGVDHIIAFEKVVGVKALSPGDLALGREAHTREVRVREEANFMQGPVTRKDFLRLVARVTELEKLVGRP